MQRDLIAHLGRVQSILVITIVAGVAGCNSTKSLRLAIDETELRQECFGQFTNTCTNKNIDFDIELLRSFEMPQWIPFPEIRTQDQMIEVFGDQGWGLFQQSVVEVRETTIKVLESKRPGWLNRWFRGDEQPWDGGARAFYAEDIGFFKQRVKDLFLQKLKNIGWHPNPEMAQRYGAAFPFPPPATTANASTQTPPQPKALTPAERAEWQRIRVLVSNRPNDYLTECLHRPVESANERGSSPRAHASESDSQQCQDRLMHLRLCALRTSEQDEQCYAEFKQADP